MQQFIDQRTFTRICAKAWAQAEPELRRPSTRFSPLDVPVLSAIKTRLYGFFGVQDEIEGVYRIQDTPSGKGLHPSEHETFAQAYMRKIGDVITGRMNPAFDYADIINTYTRRAEQYREKGPARTYKPPRKGRATGKRFPKRAP
jgi:hypothetical protein